MHQTVTNHRDRWLPGLAMIYLAAFWAMLFLPPAAARADASKAGAVKPAADADKPVSVPFEVLKTKHMAVQITVNGKGPYRVIFDTGAPMMLLNNKIAKEAELKPDPNAPKMGGLPLFGMKGQMICNEFVLGDLKVKDMPCTVMDHPLLKAFSEVVGPVDGIVGFPFFARYRCEIDYQAEKMTFVPVDYQPVLMMDAMLRMMMEQKPKSVKKVYAAPAIWGFTLADREKTDEEPGVDIREVLPGSAAADAGIKAGDRLLVLDGVWTESAHDCYRAAAHVKPGQEVKVLIMRNGKELELKVAPRAGL